MQLQVILFGLFTSYLSLSLSIHAYSPVPSVPIIYPYPIPSKNNPYEGLCQSIWTYPSPCLSKPIPKYTQYTLNIPHTLHIPTIFGVQVFWTDVASANC